MQFLARRSALMILRNVAESWPLGPRLKQRGFCLGAVLDWRVHLSLGFGSRVEAVRFG